MTARLSCRDAAPADAARVTELLAAQLAEHSLQPARSALEAAVVRLLGDPALGRVLVGAVDGVVAGVAVVTWTFSVEHGGRSAWLDELYVVPALRGRGLGTALLRAALERAAAGGAVALDLEVEAGHERVATLYARHGFVPHARRHWFRRLPGDGDRT